jgi:hypothetical protein
MSQPRNLKRLSGLLESIADQNTSFLRKCSETKILAMSDYSKAIEQYRDLAFQVLSQSSPGMSSKGHASAATAALESGEIVGEFVDALRKLRSSYYESVLNPAMKRFLIDESQSPSDVSPYYERAVRIDGLLEVVEFLKRIDSTR